MLGKPAFQNHSRSYLIYHEFARPPFERGILKAGLRFEAGQTFVV